MSAEILDRVYDAYVGEMGQSFMRETQRRIHWMCSRVRGQSVLDVGCSQGLVPILLGREGKSVVGIDTSTSAIRMADERLSSEPANVRRHVSFVEGDFPAHHFNGTAFDCVIMGEVLEHLLEPERFIDTAARLLPPGGRLVVTVPFGINDHVDHKRTFYLLEPVRLVAEQFEVVEVTVLGRWLGLVGTRRTERVPGASIDWSEEQILALEQGFNRIERELVDELSTIRARLDEANTKYRSSSEELARLKRDATHHENERKAAERARGQLEQQLSQAGLAGQSGDTEARKEINSLRAELSNQRNAAHAHELALIRVEERLAYSGRLAALELAARDTELAQVRGTNAELSSQIQKAEALSAAAVEQARRAREGYEAELLRLQTENDQSAERARLSADQAASLQFRCAQLTTGLEVAQAALAAKTDEAEVLAKSLHAEHEAARLERVEGGKLRILVEEGQLARVQVEGLKRELEAARVSLHQLRGSTEAQQREAARERDLLERRLHELESEQRDQQRIFARDLDRQRATLRDAERKVEQANQQLASANQAGRRTARQLEQERRNRAAAERKIVQTRSTLSFQLGYELIHSFKSRDRLLRLPRSLWALQKEAARRRDERARHDVPIVKVAGSSASVSTAEPAQRGPREGAPAAVTPVGSLTSESSSTRRPPPSEPLAVGPAVLPTGSVSPSVRPAPPLEKGLAGLRVACIHDEFTFASYGPECRLMPLTPANFVEELEHFDPELLFVESAWRGKDDLWGKKISHRGHELLEVVEWCKKRGVPTVFWNKEDPAHFGTFVNTAKLFDHVFTTDLDCVGRYKQALGHDRVYLLPFACQPAQHNPIEKFERKDALCFAGAYYARYPERQRDLESFAASFQDSPRLEIFDRNFGKNDPNYAFPEEYRQFIIGTLRFDEIERAYKGYRYSLNLNSIKESQTMFARRLYELLGSNTITVSNFSRGIRLMFGDLVIATDSGERAKQRLLTVAADESRSRRFRLAGLRKVMREHTYGERLRFIASRVWDRQLPDDLPLVTVLAAVRDLQTLGAGLASFQRQTYSNKLLLLVANGSLNMSELPTNARWVSAEDAERATLSELVPAGGYVATFSADDYYGPSYLLDLALATRYTKAAVIGKRSRYVRHGSGNPILEQDGAQYRVTTSLRARAALVRRDVVASISPGDWLKSSALGSIQHDACLAIDEFNYCEGGAGLTGEQAADLDDLIGLDTGLSLAALLTAAPAGALPPRSATPNQQAISAERLAGILKAPPGKPILLSLQNGELVVESALADETHEYIYANQMWLLRELGFPSSDRFHLDATPGLNIQMTILFLDENKQRLAHKLCPAARNEIAMPPAGAAYVQLGLRVYGSGTSKIRGFLLDHVALTPERIFGRSQYLLLTNHYPSDHDLYRNGFVHRRVKDYQRQGVQVDVFRHRRGEKLGHREFDGVDVMSGGDDILASVLRSNEYKAVLVHFLDPAMWQVLRKERPSLRPLLWLHGAEIQAWHRRNFGDTFEVDEQAAKLKSAKRDAFWRQVLCELPPDGKLIFVSRQFAQESLSDLGLDPEHQRCTVIHNLIDGRLFAYRRKTPEQRTRVLSIRPFMSRKYGNDLSVAAILSLRSRPYFQDLFFHLVGDGPLFDETVAPLRGLPNVRLDKGFLTQQEIAGLHRDYGVFLCPTRNDTQGVSRDEAMASGLVPVTTRVAAVPEFVDESCAILAEPESYGGLADGIARLYEDPATFTRLSEQAALRVRRQSGPEQTTARELALILGQGQ